ncbi:unnamed protein product [Parajaminaea phylloscopi]
MDTRKFPGDAAIKPPSDIPNRGPGASELNPGGVYPATETHTDPNPPQQEGGSIFQSIENPYALREAVNKLESSLEDVIRMFEQERETLASDGNFEHGKEGLSLFRSWKDTLEKLKRGDM